MSCDCVVQSTRTDRVFALTISRLTKHDAAGATAAGAAGRKDEMAELRDALKSRLGALNAPPSATRPAASSSGTGGDAPSAAAPPNSLVCPPAFGMTRWKGGKDFAKTGLTLRQAAAEDHESPAAMAALAEFYLGNAMGGEALGTALAALTAPVAPDAEAPRPADLARLQRDADIARLLRGEPVDPASALLAAPGGCDRPDIGLWRALAAAAAHDPQAVAHNAAAARAALRDVPEPLLQAFAFRIADASGQDASAMQEMAASLRDVTTNSPADEAARWLLHAKIARAGGDTAGETSFLERAAKADRTAPGFAAKVRLAALAAVQDGPPGERAEALLSDVARVYRDDALGRDATAALVERRLHQGDYAAGLRLADESAGPTGASGPTSYGAELAANILRRMFVAPLDKNLPEPADRIALYWHYDGYATPGQKGDDIRLGVARLLLAQDLGSAALDVTRQLAPETAATDDAKTLRSTAEARSGDPAVALLMLHDLPPTDDIKHTSADSLERLGRLADAAHALDGMTGMADRARRARLLSDGKAWGEAAEAYADILRDPAVSGDTRVEMADRYSFALALAGKPADATLPAVTAPVAAQVLAALPRAGAEPAPNAPPSMASVRGALARSKQIEGLLPASPPNKGI
jgi:hypothetical protein